MTKKTTGDEAPPFKTWRSIIPFRGWVKGKRVKPEKKPRAPKKAKPAPRISLSALVLGALTDQPQPAERIAPATGLPVVKVAARLKELVGRGIVIATRAGFRN